ncbi:hypothetical protein CYMTET_24117 [Cymbomonas tetramitiformis]|uniref:Uncharacterized protein n=1 Tax=Cymbomonas tetramitiformis TaxID=36881 RepID=A0AAE0L0L0_9CHLO|nr:hypothetical protein CYMTET_24117 [Cymbomonas tetramitiformis]
METQWQMASTCIEGLDALGLDQVQVDCRFCHIGISKCLKCRLRDNLHIESSLSEEIRNRHCNLSTNAALELEDSH